MKESDEGYSDKETSDIGKIDLKGAIRGLSLEQPETANLEGFSIDDAANKAGKKTNKSETSHGPKDAGVIWRIRDGTPLNAIRWPHSMMVSATPRKKSTRRSRLLLM
jgi:hypothetical protein